jgi:uncharacterized membrane protein SirB2
VNGRQVSIRMEVTVNIEFQLWCITLLAITAGVLLFALFGIGAVRAVAVWLGNKLAGVFYGNGRPR